MAASNWNNGGSQAYQYLDWRPAMDYPLNLLQSQIRLSFTDDMKSYPKELPASTII